jgi:hypothetical protein
MLCAACLPFLLFVPVVFSYDMTRVVRISETVWRLAAAEHQNRIRELLLPGLTSPTDPCNHHSQRNTAVQHDGWTALDVKNPVYNFMIEYYGLKGAKGPRKLARWSPSLDLLQAQDKDGILLENASQEDIGGILHMRGAIFEEDGIVYSPSHFFGKGDPERRTEAARAATPYLWFRSILQQTLTAEPILHCHGLHEWAMQYQPEGAPPPPSGKYQAHIPLRVDRETITQTVERKGVHCTHVDALRFFAPAAAPLNHHGASLERTDQLRLEQPACVHAHMDLLKIVLRIQPFCDAELLRRVVEIALQARRLDVAASPYDVSSYGVGVVAVETPEGRALYREEQTALMMRAEPIRLELLRAYDMFLSTAFDEDVLDIAADQPRAERFAKSEPGGLPWRQNLITR